MEIRAIVINAKDNVATVVEDTSAGAQIYYSIGDEKYALQVKEPIPLGHKVAIADIKAMSHVIKYGESIGRATRDIQAGQHVHVHNMESLRGRGDWAEDKGGRQDVN